MSIRAYRLLRNNQEQGPFTAEEIVQKNLKPYDLIWIDGRSAAWSYPGEMAEFKMFAPLPGEQNLNPQTNKQQNTIPVSASVQAAIAVNNTINESSIKQKPRYKVSAAWSKIQTVTAPAYKSPMVSEEQKEALKKTAETKQDASINSKSLSWKEAWLDWENEKQSSPYVVVPEKIKQTPQKKTINEKYTAPVLETKYTEPLDSIKDKYIDNILQQKQKAKKSFSLGKYSEFTIPTVALVIIFSVGYWLAHGNNETAAALNSVTPKKVQAAPATNTSTVSSNNNNNSTLTSQENTPDIKRDVIATSQGQPLVADKAEDRKPSYVHAAKLTDEKKNSIPANQANNTTQQLVSSDPKTVQTKTADQTTKQFDPAIINNIPNDNTSNNAAANPNDLNAAESRPTRRRTYDIDQSNTNTESSQKEQSVVIKPAAKKTSASYVNVPEYIEMSNGSADLKIRNISDVNLDLVVVDVQYFDASNHFRKGETLYLHNLKAGKNIVVKTPKDSNSMYATSKVSLVSSDANNVNIVSDN